MVAGGFGIGTPSSTAPQEIAAVVPYRDGLGDRRLSELRQHAQEESDDIEKGISSAKAKDSINSIDSQSEYSSPLPLDTPFFHIDLQSAVQAAESGLVNLS